MHAKKFYPQGSRQQYRRSLGSSQLTHIGRMISADTICLSIRYCEWLAAYIGTNNDKI